MLNVFIRGRVRCPKHPRFRPQAGVWAVKGGCPICYQEALLYDAAATLQRGLEQLQADARTLRESLCGRGC